ncbi:MAG: hypothetical protein AAF387_16995 [Pseudomonadota bacterium]
MLRRFAPICHRHLDGEIRRIVCVALIFSCCAHLVACSSHVVQGRQITGASPIRQAQHFETEVVSHDPTQCVVNTKWQNQRLPGTWIDERNSALRAALIAAQSCCEKPQLRSVEDWMVGFTAYQAKFDCLEN